jgi:hypothetical protein
MRRGTFIAVFLLLATGAQAAGPRQTATFTFSTREPGQPTGGVLSMNFVNPDDPGGKPWSVAHVDIHSPEGTTLDTEAITQCTASDAELQAQGAEACPAESRLGGGTIVSDTGSSAGFPRFVENHADNFNNQDEVVGVADSTNIPVVPGFSRVVIRTKLEGNTSSFDFPEVPGKGPPDNYAAIKTLRLTAEPVIQNGRAYSRTPPTCPPSGQWTGSIDFTYRDGVKQTVVTSSPCNAPAPARPSVRLAGAPHRCVSKTFVVRVRSTGATRTKVYVDGRRIRSTRTARFRQRVRVRRLRPGRHRLTARARGRGGRAARTVRFTRCKRR